MKVFSEKLNNLWSKFQLRSAVLVSLFLQITLILLASFRKRSRSRLLSISLWVAYLLADSVAVFALGHVLDTEDDNVNNDLLGFWSAFLLVHLGGPETISAFSMEDNELWRRHLFNFAVQVILVIYSFIRCLTTTRLVAPACFVFLAGVIKYGERIWALRYASKDQFKDAQLTQIDAQKTSSEISEEEDIQLTIVDGDLTLTEDEDISEENVLAEAYRFFKTFQRLIVDLIFSSDELDESKRFFLKRSSKQAFKIVEVELNYFYDVLYTKAVIVHSLWGYVFPLISFISIILALLLFVFATNKNGYDPSDIYISYILLGGAFMMDVYAFTKTIFSDLTMVRLKPHLKSDLISLSFKRAFFFFYPPKEARWSNSIGQYNLIRVCVADQSQTRWKSIMHLFKVKELWDKYYYTKFISITPALHNIICWELKNKVIKCDQPNDFKDQYRQRGKWTLEQYLDSLPEVAMELLKRSLDVEFDESILICHIATDMCHHVDDPHQYAEKMPLYNSDEISSLSELSKYISEFMLYLLVHLPDMVGAGIGNIRFRDTCAEVNYKIKEGEPNEAHASELLFRKYRRRVIQRKKSVLYKAGEVATQLRNIEQPKIIWKIISGVWVEMLCYAASHCRGYIHAQQLSVGGELVTLVWLMMAHLGIVAEFRIDGDEIAGFSIQY